MVHRIFPMASSEHPLNLDQVCSNPETELLSKVVGIAEKAGKPVHLLVAPASDPSCAIVLTAQKLQSQRIVMSRCPYMSPEEQARELGRAWETLPEPRPLLTVEVSAGKDGRSAKFLLGRTRRSYRPRISN